MPSKTQTPSFTDNQRTALAELDMYGPARREDIPVSGGARAATLVLHSLERRGFVKKKTTKRNGDTYVLTAAGRKAAANI